MTAQDDSAVRMLFKAMIDVMHHAGLNNAQIMEALKSLTNNWWIDTTWRVCASIAESLMGVMN